MILELVIIIAALVLIYIIWSPWFNRRRTGDGAEAPASEIYNEMATNWNPYNLMVDFKEPIPKVGPDPVDTTRIETFKFSP